MAKKSKDGKVKGIIFEKFRIIKADSLNWAIEPIKEKGEGKRKYFPRLESALIHSLEEMAINDIEKTQIKKAIKKIKGYKEEIIKAIKEYKIDV